MTKMDWHHRFADMATLVAEWSKDESTKVGAVIVRNRVILSTGYNGLPKGVDDLASRRADRDIKYPMTVHAEVNAILQSTTDLKDATIYVTHHPCARCAGVIIQAGIKQVVIRTRGKGLNENWDKETQLAREMFFEAEINVTDIADFDQKQQMIAAE